MVFIMEFINDKVKVIPIRPVTEWAPGCLSADFFTQCPFARAGIDTPSSY